MALREVTRGVSKGSLIIMAPQNLLCSGYLRISAAVCRRWLISILAILGSNLLLFAAAPPTTENAYCAKGDVPRFGEKDGPAQLPTACYYTAMDGTPSPGKQIRVSAKADFTSALNGAKCGDTLLLAAGSSYEVKDLPSKKCDNQHYLSLIHI